MSELVEFKNFIWDLKYIEADIVEELLKDQAEKTKREVLERIVIEKEKYPFMSHPDENLSAARVQGFNEAIDKLERLKEQIRSEE